MWIETLIEKITSFVPRIILIRPDEGGFRMTPKLLGGSWLKELVPGKWYFLIPLIMEHEICKTKTQVVDLRVQSVATTDQENLIIGLTIRYYVQSPIKALLEVHDYDQSIQNICFGIVQEFIEEHSKEELWKSRPQLKEKILKAIREEASGWGLKIQSVKISDFGSAINIRLLPTGE